MQPFHTDTYTSEREKPTVISVREILILQRQYRLNRSIQIKTTGFSRTWIIRPTCSRCKCMQSHVSDNLPHLTVSSHLCVFSLFSFSFSPALDDDVSPGRSRQRNLQSLRFFRTLRTTPTPTGSAPLAVYVLFQV